MLDFEISEIAYKPRWLKLAVLAGITALGLISGYVLLLKPQLAHLEQLRQQEHTLKTTIDTARQMVKQLSQYRLMLAQENAREQAFSSRLLSQGEMSALLQAINQQGHQQQISFVHLDWGEPKLQSDFVELPLMLELSGNYHQIARFSQGLAAIPHWVHVKDFTLWRSHVEGQQVSMRISGTSYQAKPAVLQEKQNGQ